MWEIDFFWKIKPINCRYIISGEIRKQIFFCLLKTKIQKLFSNWSSKKKKPIASACTLQYLQYKGVGQSRQYEMQEPITTSLQLP